MQIAECDAFALELESSKNVATTWRTIAGMLSRVYANDLEGFH
jgi:hypothetical protein